MTIRTERPAPDSMVLFLSGRLDTASSCAFELNLNELIDGTADIIFDFKDLGYISSSGLHVLLQAQKTMTAKNRKLVMRNVSGAVKDVFEMTGFTSIVTLE